MNKKLAREVAQPFMIIGLVGMLVLSIVLLWLNLYVGLGAMVLSGLVYLFHLRFTQNYVERSIEKFEKNVLREREDFMDAFSQRAPLLICVVNRAGELVWNNPAFAEAFPEEDSAKAVLNVSSLAPFFEDPDHSEVMKVGSKFYSVTAAATDLRGRERRMLFWQEVTELKGLKTYIEDTRACLAYISVDNYDEMLEASPIEEQSSIAAQIDKTIHNWAISMQAALLRARSDRYLMAFEHQYLPQLRETRFPILNEMHDIETKADFPTSISIGICTGESTLEELQESAAAALDLALGRGGDQAVIRRRGGETEYYGGALPSVEKRNKGKSRVMSHMLSQLIENSTNVIIAGHARPDMDCFGAALGVYALASNMKKPVGIVLENPGDGIELIYKAALGLNAFEFYSHEKALSELKSDTLVVMVDHHRPAISEFPELLSSAKKIAVIDHHRRAKDAVESPVLSYMETYASSSCELVTELLQYSGDRGEISRFEAEALLAGITLDTKNFTVNSGVRTFEAASWLRRSGADNANVKNFFKVSLEFYQKKAAIISAAEILPNGVAVAYTRDQDPAMQILVSQVADELLDMKGVDGSIVAGRGEGRTMVSARSNGKINVQTLMEKLGGGGHQNVAAAQVTVGPEEAIALAVHIMRDEGIL
ncbi:MAG: DHH family phosphoesterase [Firmicutes bacterium]|nr:DHH family phosphoesterase [Bacillota bacterium]